jgi:PKD repeat protein
MKKQFETIKLLIVVIFLLTSLSCKKDKKDTPVPSTPSGNSPNVEFTFTPDNSPAPATVTFTNQSTNATSYEWNFGDNTTSTATNPTKVYSSSGTFNVKLKAMNASGTSEKTKTVTVSQAVTNLLISQVKITNGPALVGMDWDVWGDLPGDPYFEWYNNSTLAYTSSVFIDKSSYPVYWNVNLNVSATTFSNVRNLKFYDDDNPSADDYIGQVSFTPSTYLASKPSTITLSNSGLTVVLTCQWQ